MSTAAVLDPKVPGRRPVPGRLSFPNVLRSEWTKFWSLRSTRWAVFAAAFSMIAVGIIAAVVQIGSWHDLTLVEKAEFKPIDEALGGFNFAQLAIGGLGVLIVTGEYTTGMIRSTMMAVPKRTPVLWAKLGVFCSVVFVLMLVASLAAFLSSEAIYDSHHAGVGLGAPHALRAVVGNALFMTVLGALCVGIGSLVRNSAGGISAFVSVLFVIPGVAELLPERIETAIHPYLPSSAGEAVAQAVPDPHTLAPWTGFGLFLAYSVGTIAVAAWLLRRRDV